MRQMFFSSSNRSQTSPNKAQSSAIIRIRRQIRFALKRGFDISVTVLSAILLLPFFLFIGIWIKCDSPGPIFFRGRRIGKNGRIFHILKFRTMYENPASYRGPKVTGQNDPRITNAGRWLRHTKLNELPQIWNVFVGDMSLVGPRPEDPDIAATWPAATRKRILSMRPGITSPASVIYRNEESLLNNDEVMRTYLQSIMPSKLRLDQLYVHHHSLWVDIDVLIWTLLVVVVPGFGSYHPPEARLFLGPVARMKHRYFNWFSIDLITTFIAFVLAAFLMRVSGPFHLGWFLTSLFSLIFALLFSLSGAVMGVHDIFWSKATATDLFDLIPAVGVPTVIAMGANYLFNIFPLGVILLAGLFSFVGFTISRYRSRLFSGLAWRLMRLRNGLAVARERVLIIGGGRSGQLVSWLLKDYLKADALHMVGFVDDDLYKQGVRVNGIRVIGQNKDIPELVEKYDVGLIIFAIHNIPSDQQQRLINTCRNTPARVKKCPDFLETLTQIVAFDDSLKNGNHQSASI